MVSEFVQDSAGLDQSAANNAGLHTSNLWSAAVSMFLRLTLLSVNNGGSRGAFITLTLTTGQYFGSACFYLHSDFFWQKSTNFFDFRVELSLSVLLFPSLHHCWSHYPFFNHLFQTLRPFVAWFRLYILLPTLYNTHKVSWNRNRHKWYFKSHCISTFSWLSCEFPQSVSNTGGYFH